MIIPAKRILAISCFFVLSSWSYPSKLVQGEETHLDGFPKYSKATTENPEEAWIKTVRLNSNKFESKYEFDGYSDYSKIVFRVSLSKGFWFSGKAGNGTKIKHRWSGWIDFNQNGSFEDAEIFMESTQLEFSRKVRLSEDIPENLTTRMRIFFGSKKQDLCRGEFEDYSVKIVP